MKAKRMSAQYPGRCKKCGARFSAGMPIYWSKSSSSICVKCAEGDGGGNKKDEKNETQKAQDAPKGKTESKKGNSALPQAISAGNDSFFTIDWSELREHLKSAVFDGNFSFLNRRENQNHAKRHTAAGNWHGFTANQVREWLRDGYRTTAIENLGDFTPPLRDKRHYIYAEEGEEIHVDRVLSGEDNFMGDWTKRERIPGVAIEAEIMFSAGVSAEVVNAYNAWVCKAVYALESAGIDCQVTLKFSSNHLFNSQNAHSIVRVKKENEASDFWNFSPMLSPAALRCFGFVAMTMHADSRGMDANAGLGRGRSNNSWAVRWDEERRILTLDCPYAMAYSFPEEDMSNQLRDALHAMKSAG